MKLTEIELHGILHKIMNKPLEFWDKILYVDQSQFIDEKFSFHKNSSSFIIVNFDDEIEFYYKNDIGYNGYYSLTLSGSELIKFQDFIEDVRTFYEDNIREEISNILDESDPL